MSEVAKSRERFERETAEHQMTVRHDYGLYRHLRFQKPGTWSYGFDLVTWPGFLAVTGDCGDFMFSRIPDMFEFFGPSGSRGGFEDERWGINPQYWAEKLQGPGHDTARRYSPEALRARVEQWLADLREWDELDDEAGMRAALEEQVLNEDVRHDESAAHTALRDFEHEGRHIMDPWEWDLREYDWQFLWCCWAIVWGIGQYRAAATSKVPSVA